MRMKQELSLSSFLAFSLKNTGLIYIYEQNEADDDDKQLITFSHLMRRKEKSQRRKRKITTALEKTTLYILDNQSHELILR